MTIVLPAPPEPHPPSDDPVTVAVRLRPARTDGMAQRFAPTDEPARRELTRHGWVARLFRSRTFPFAFILASQIVIWLVILSGFAGTVDPGLNFGTAITWYLWFCLVFVLMVVIGRGWCAICPFGGFAEWVQRRSLWQRAQRGLGLNRTMPEKAARYGLLLSAGTFLVLTFVEEFFNIAGPGAPHDTSWMVVGIVISALLVFLVFERRTFCRYLCPMSCVIGTVGTMGSAAGFRTKDRDVCASCATKECMRGGDSNYGCPWYTWPGSAETNQMCGLCADCFKGCPSKNVGLYSQKPLTSMIAPHRRRADVAWAVMVLFALVVYQQVNALSGYTTVDDWLNKHMGWAHYPNPLAYFGGIVVFAAVSAAGVWALSRMFGRRDIPVVKGSFLERTGRFRAFFLPLAYAFIPLMAADYLARQLPKFFEYAPRLVPAIGHPFGLGSSSSYLYNFQMLHDNNIVIAQVALMAIAAAIAGWTTWRIAGAELAPVSTNPRAVRFVSTGFVAGIGLATCFLYVIMHAAT